MATMQCCYFEKHHFLSTASAGKYKLWARVGKYKFGARAGKYKLGARAGKYKFGARAGKYKFGVRTGGREIQIPSFCRSNRMFVDVFIDLLFL